MAPQDDQSVLKWINDGGEDRVGGEVEVVQSPTCKDFRRVYAVITRRRSEQHNTVNRACLNQFEPGSWEKIGQQIPSDGDEIKLRLIHEGFSKTHPLYFRVDDNEPCQVVLGSEALEKIDASWRRSDGSIAVIRGSRARSAITEAAALASAATEARRQKEREDEQRDRQESRHARSAGSTASAASSVSNASQRSSGQ